MSSPKLQVNLLNLLSPSTADRDHKMAVTPSDSLSQEQADMLATKWWSIERFRSHGETTTFTPGPTDTRTGVHCCGGVFTLVETDSVKDAVRRYQEVSLMVPIPTCTL